MPRTFRVCTWPSSAAAASARPLRFLPRAAGAGAAEEDEEEEEEEDDADASLRRGIFYLRQFVRARGILQRGRTGVCMKRTEQGGSGGGEALCGCGEVLQKRKS